WPALRLGAAGRRAAHHLEAARRALVEDRFADAADALDAALALASPRWTGLMLELAAIATAAANAAGDLARARRQLGLVAAAAAGRRDPAVDAALARRRAEVLRLEGSFPAARRELDRAAAALAGDRRPVRRAMVHLQRALLAAEEGGHEEAAREADAVLALLRPRGRRRDRGAAADTALAMTAAARAAAAAGDLATATERLAAAEALVDGRSPGYVTARIPLARATVALAAGDPATAAAEAEAARSAFVAMGAADAAEASVDLGRALRTMGDRHGARRRFEEAAAAFERHGWHHWLAVARAELGATG
ncbi:MAG TPA: hypothetical protein VGB14_03970, partial [Acidimicrobiales bacterium]